MVYKLFDKKAGLGVSVNEKLSEEYARFKENIWVADIAGIISLSSNNRNIRYLLSVKDVFTKYALVKLL